MPEISKGFNFDDFNEQCLDGIREFEESKTAFEALRKQIDADFEYVADLHDPKPYNPPIPKMGDVTE